MAIKKHYDAFVGKFVSGENEDSTLPLAEAGESASAAEFVADGSPVDHDGVMVESVSESEIVSDAVITPLSSDTARGSSEMIVLWAHQ